MAEADELSQKAMADREAIKELTESHGWRILRARFQDRIDYLSRQLETCPLEQVPEIRTQISALRWTLSLPQGMLAKEESVVSEESVL